jgi:DNA-directed RNA polymerase subunit RPC12/RpoP
MDGQCLKCGTHVSAPWKFCPACGTRLAQETHPEAIPHQSVKSTIEGGFAGLYLGIIAVPILAIVGTLLCLTGLGAIVGVPMIAAAIVAPLLGPMIGLGTLRGKCPWCGTAVSNITSHPQGFYCHACSKRMAVEDRKFVRVIEA